MAVKYCANCEGKVSEALDQCPHCGHPISARAAAAIRLAAVPAKPAPAAPSCAAAQNGPRPVASPCAPAQTDSSFSLPTQAPRASSSAPLARRVSAPPAAGPVPLVAVPAPLKRHRDPAASVFLFLTLPSIGLAILGGVTHIDRLVTFGAAGVAASIVLAILTLGLNRKHIICPNVNCNYRGLSRRTSRGSTLTGLFLLLLGLIPGLLYFCFKSGYRHSCPRCGLQISNDN